MSVRCFLLPFHTILWLLSYLFDNRKSHNNSILPCFFALRCSRSLPLISSIWLLVCRLFLRTVLLYTWMQWNIEHKHYCFALLWRTNNRIVRNRYRHHSRRSKDLPNVSRLPILPFVLLKAGVLWPIRIFRYCINLFLDRGMLYLTTRSYRLLFPMSRIGELFDIIRCSAGRRNPERSFVLRRFAWVLHRRCRHVLPPQSFSDIRWLFHIHFHVPTAYKVRRLL